MSWKHNGALGPLRKKWIHEWKRSHSSNPQGTNVRAALTVIGRFLSDLRSSQWARSKRRGLTPVSEPSCSLRKIHGRVCGGAPGMYVRAPASRPISLTPKKLHLWSEFSSFHHNNTRPRARVAPFYCTNAAMMFAAAATERRDERHFLPIKVNIASIFPCVCACRPHFCSHPASFLLSLGLISQWSKAPPTLRIEFQFNEKNKEVFTRSPPLCVTGFYWRFFFLIFFM